MVVVTSFDIKNSIDDELRGKRHITILTNIIFCLGVSAIILISIIGSATFTGCAGGPIYTTQFSPSSSSVDESTSSTSIVWEELLRDQIICQ